MKSPKAAFILVCWNNAALLKECLDSIAGQEYKNFEVIMVDNGSSDDSVEVAKRSMPTIKVLETGRNNGFARGNNIGIEEALKDPEVAYIALVNTDARLDEQWLAQLVGFAQNRPRVACLQGTNLNYSDHSIIDSTHLYFTRGGQGAQGNWLKPYLNEIGPKKVFGVNAAACLMSRRFIEKQPYKHLFDESLFMYLEDVDIAIRSTIMGWDNYLVPEVRAYHMGSASSGGDTGFSKFGLYMTFRNNLGVIIKNYPWPTLLRLLLVLPLTDYRTVRHLVRLGQSDIARAVIKGRLTGLLRSPLYLLKRWKMVGKRKLDRRYLWLLMDKGY